MKTRLAILGFCLAALGVSLAAGPQNPPPTPPPIPPPQIQIGGRGVPGGITNPSGGAQPGRSSVPPAPLVTTGLIVGRVIDPATGKGVSSAVVTLNGGPTRVSVAVQPGQPPVQMGPPPPPPQVMTDSDGRFAFLNLTRGNFTLSATRTGYSPGAYGRMRPNGSSRSLQLDDGEKMGDVTIRLFKYGSVSGTIIDEGGEPVVQTAVRAYRRVLVAGRRVLQPTGGFTQTDDRGMYRLGNLMPGEYVILAPIVPLTAPNAAPVAGNRQNLQATTQMLSSGAAPSPGAGGQVIGGDARFVLQRNSGMAGDVSALPDASGRMFGFASVYYPSSPTAATAQSISLQSGEEKAGIDIAMRRVPMASISGVITGTDTPAMDYAIRLIPADSTDIAQEPEAAVAMSDGSGAFMFFGVPAGQYMIQTVRIPRQAPPEPVRVVPPGAAVTPLPPKPPTVEPLLWAMTPVAVGDTDVRGIVLNLREGLTVSGRFEFTGSRPKPEGQRLLQVPIVLEAADGRQQNFSGGPPSRASADGRFLTTGQLPGKYFIRVGGPPGGWYVSTITANGIDVTEAPIELSTGSINNVVVTFTDVTQDVRGNITGVPAGTEAPMVVMYPSDSNGWKNYGINPTRIKSTRAAQNGAFAIGALPPGDYFAVAIPDEYSTEWQDPAYLEALTRTATRFALAPGERKTLDVSVTDVKPPSIGRAPQPAPLLTPVSEPDLEDADTAHGPFVAGPPQQVRDTRPAPTTGGGAISGVVRVDNGSLAPARYARVSVRMAGVPERTTLTDEEGRYNVSGLQAGSYQVSVSKPSYLTMNYGARRSNVAQGTPVRVEAGQVVKDVDVTLQKGGVVTGVIIGADGEPASGIRVQLHQRLLTDGEVRLSGAAASGQLMTDDRGMFRIFGIRPGSYAISATPPANIGSGSEVRQLSDQEIQAAVAAANAARSRMPAATTPAGLGSRVLAPASGPIPTPPPVGRPVGFAPIYYPGTTLEDQAGIFTITPGQEMRVSIGMQLVPTARIEGTIVTAEGQPASIQGLQLSLQRAASTATPMAQVRMVEAGRFQAIGVPPGRYMLTARMNWQEGRPAAPNGPQPPAGQWFAQQEIEVVGVDLAGIALTLAPPMNLTGRVVFEGGSPAPDAQVQVRLDSAGRMPVASFARSLKLSDNGEFTMTGVTPGRYRLNASVITPNPNPGQPVAANPNAPPPWEVKSAVIDGRDALETPFEIQMGRAPQGALITLTNRLPQLSASIVDAGGKLVPNMIFVLFSANRDHWTGTSARRVRMVSRANDDGIYQFNSILPGEYLLAVLTEIEANDQYDPNFLDQLVPAAIKITLAEGDRKTQQLKMAGGRN